MYFEIKGTIEDIEPIATGSSIRDLFRLKKQFGPGRGVNLRARQTSNLTMDTFGGPRCIGTKPTELGGGK
jgi:hypothetical protein